VDLCPTVFVSVHGDFLHEELLELAAVQTRLLCVLLHFS
jgi:hypothetical protein